MDYTIYLMIIALSIFILSSKDTFDYGVYILLMCLLCVHIYFKCRKEDYELQMDPKLQEIKARIKPIFTDGKVYTGRLEKLNNYDFENIMLYKGDKSYTINKTKVYICLKDSKNNYYEDQMLIYVILHELSHVLCNSVGHTEEFNEIFDDLLEEASNRGIYDKNYKTIEDYCEY